MAQFPAAGLLRFARNDGVYINRHGEERSDEAIYW
jgi:hypothetical protein